MTNKFAKYCPNVWLAHCLEKHEQGEIIQVANKYGTEVNCEIHNLVVSNLRGFFYSITRCDGMNRQTYAQRKAEKYDSWASSAKSKSDEFYQKSQNCHDFLSLGEPIKVGHHSEIRHRKLLEGNHSAMRSSIEQSLKAKQHSYKLEYWESQKGKIDLSMPESIEYFAHELEVATAHHALLKSDLSKRSHSMSLSYASKEVKDLQSKVATSIVLWATEGQEQKEEIYD